MQADSLSHGSWPPHGQSLMYGMVWTSLATQAGTSLRDFAVAVAGCVAAWQLCLGKG